MLEKALQTIRRQTWISIAVTLILVIALAGLLNNGTSPWGATRINSLIGLLGTAVCSLALPIFIRTSEYQKSVKNKGMSVSRFRRMKLLSLYSVNLGTFFALMCWYIPVYRYHMYLAMLAGIYGIYSVLPMKQGDVQDIKGFGVLDE